MIFPCKHSLLGSITGMLTAVLLVASPAPVVAGTQVDVAIGVSTPHAEKIASSAALLEQKRIREVQGRAHISPLLGHLVSTDGVVTTLSRDGFWLQDPGPRLDPSASDGLFVRTGNTP